MPEMLNMPETPEMLDMPEMPEMLDMPEMPDSRTETESEKEAGA